MPTLDEGRFTIRYKGPPENTRHYRGDSIYKFLGTSDWFYVNTRSAFLTRDQAELRLRDIYNDPYKETGWEYGLWRIE